ncbi:M20/M25/M40 family metallo-hydrolase [candidate division KSB1 bacterium]
MFSYLEFFMVLVLLIMVVPSCGDSEKEWKETGDEALSLFQEYLKIDTTNPPGDVSNAAEFLKKQFDLVGIPVEFIWTDEPTGRLNVLARLKGTGEKRPLMMLHHMDTVPVDLDSWTQDHLGGEIIDGNIYGRGSLDMKNNGIVQLMTMLMLARNEVELDRDVIFLAVCDEETSGELGSGWIAENNWGEIEAEFILDEGGFGTQGFFTNDDRLIFSVGVAEKKVCWLRLTTEGTPGHGSMPPKDNANFIMARALGKVADYETPIRITPVVEEMQRKIGDLDDTPYNNALKRNTISLTVMKGFVGNPPKTNVIPDESEAVLDCRLLPDQDPEEFIDDLKSVIDDPRIKIEYIEEPKESIVAPFDTEIFEIIEEETKEVYPESVTLPHLIIYGTDSRFFRQKGATCYGFFPGPVTMEEYRNIHGHDEHIREESFRNAVKIYYNVVKKFCEKD